jgi:hypothetical protein
LAWAVPAASFQMIVLVSSAIGPTAPDRERRVRHGRWFSSPVPVSPIATMRVGATGVGAASRRPGACASGPRG